MRTHAILFAGENTMLRLKGYSQENKFQFVKENTKDSYVST